MSISYCYPYMQPISEDFRINTKYFAPRDLQLFIESLETISRIERNRHERQRMAAAAMNNTCEKILEEAAEPVTHLEAKKIPDYQQSYDSDEAYSGSAQTSPRSSVVYAVPYAKAKRAASSGSTTPSDSEESGVFAVNEQQSELSPHEYENIEPLRPRSELITKPKCRTARSRIIGMVLKREYAQHADKANAECRDRVLDEVIKHKYESLSTLKSKKHSKSRQAIGCRPGSAEERFLEKALRYLTL